MSQQSMRIIHVLRAPLGGLFRHVVDLTKEQIARGHKVGLVIDSLTANPRADAMLESLGPTLELGVMRMPMLRRPQFADVTNVLKVERFIRECRADVVHCHGSKGGVYGRTAALWSRGNGPIRCYTPHGGSFNHVARPPLQAIYMTVERVLAHFTDVMLFESVFIANRFHQRIGETSAMIRIIQNGIGPDEFEPVTPDREAADFVYVGELRAAKGIDTLIDALSILKRRLARPATLNLVGTGPDQAELERRATRRGVVDDVRFLGQMRARQAFALGRSLVVPSRAESLPYIVLEGAGAQIPMVATDVGGIGEVFGPHRNGLVAGDDPVRLASAMEAMVRGEPAAIAARARDIAGYAATRFSIDIMTGSVIAAYRDAMARRTHIRPYAKILPAHP